MTERKRPVFVWFILVFFLLLGAYMALLGYGLLFSRAAIDKEILAYWDTYTRFDFLSIAGLEIVNLAAAVSLFFMRKDGFYLFVFALCLNLLLALWGTLTKGWAAHNQSSLFTGGVVGILFQIVFVLYAWRMMRDGRLK